MTMQVIERSKAHYEVKQTEMGKLYRWCPESVIIECNCGAKPGLTVSRTTCSECGVDHATIVEEVVEARPEDRGDRPWRFLHDDWELFHRTDPAFIPLTSVAIMPFSP